jgi:hypothetical protein
VTALPDTTNGLLREAGIDPELVSALSEVSELTRLNETAFRIPFSAAGRPLVEGFWSLNGGEEALPDGGRVAYWPLGHDGSTVIVVVGTGDALFLSSLLVHVGFNGEIFRRPNCPPVLEDAVIAALPEMAPGVALEFISEPQLGVEDLMGELLTPERRTAILAIPRVPVELQPLTATFPPVEAFIDQFLQSAVKCELLPILALRPVEKSWAKTLESYSDATKRFAFAAVLDYMRQVAPQTPDLTPNTKGDER